MTRSSDDRRRSRDRQTAPYAKSVGWFGVVVLLWSAPAVHAAETLVDASLAAGGLYNDNIQLTTVPHDSVSGYVAEPALRFESRTPAWSNRFNGRVRMRRYPNEKRLDFNDKYLDYINRFRGDRSEWNLRLDASDTSTLTSEFEDVGLVQVSRSREQWGVRPSWAWALTEKSTLEFGYYYTDVTYDDAAAIGVTDYFYRTASLQLAHRLTERDLFTVSTYGARYKARTFFVRSEDLGIELGWEHNFTQTLAGSVVAGGRNSKVKTVAIDDEDNGFIGRVGLAQTGERSSWKFTASRAITPSGAGTLNETNSGALALEQGLTPKLTLVAAVNGYRTKALNPGVNNLDRKYRRGRLTLGWAFSREWRLDGSVSYANQKYDSNPDDADQTIVEVRLAYSWPQLRLSQ